jgi:hypothetical protein
MGEADERWFTSEVGLKIEMAYYFRRRLKIIVRLRYVVQHDHQRTRPFILLYAAYCLLPAYMPSLHI